MAKKLDNFLTAALDKLSAQQVKAVTGQKEKAMASAVAEALRHFCRQDAEFAQAVAQGGTLADCMKAVAKGIGNSISDLDAYKKAVKFYFPGADIHMTMRVDLIGKAAEPEPEAHEQPALRVVRPEPTSLVLDLDDFF